MSFIGLPNSALTLGVVLVCGGLGGAAFHPPAAALVYRIADHRKGLAMSAHISGGSLGFAVAPLRVRAVHRAHGPGGGRR